MWKFAGAVLGLLIGGLIGAVAGFAIGWYLDQSSGGGRASILGGFVNIEAKRRQYFESTFRLLGHVAKADGRISEEEVQLTEQLMQRMGLNSEHRKEAIAQFKSGASPAFDSALEVQAFVQQCGARSSLANMLVVTLLSLMFADSKVDAAEHAAVQQVAISLGFSQAQFEQLLGMVAAQQGFASGGSSQQAGGHSPADALAQAYQALGVSPDIDDKSLKRAYRKLISKHHPDKLIAQGVPDDMVALATEKTQEIQAAYELIERHRKQA